MRVFAALVLLALASPARAVLLRIIDDPRQDAGGQFGRALAAVDGDLAVGAPGAPVFGRTGAGVVQLLRSDGAVRRTFQAPQAVEGAGLGTMLAARADLLYASAPEDQPFGVGGVGAVYVFDAVTGAVVRIIRAPDPDASTVSVGGVPTRGGLPASTGPFPVAGGFGLALALDGGRLFVGAPHSTVDELSDAGAVYVYDLEGRLLHTLRDFPAQAGARFGASLAALGGTLFVGVPGEESLGVDQAGVVRVVDAETGAVRTTMRAGIASQGAALGTAVREAGGRLFAGAPGDRVRGVDGAGATYVFRAGTGVLERILTAPTPSTSLGFGGALLAVDGDLLVGADEEAGRAFLFDGARLAETFEPFERVGGRFGIALEAVGPALAIGEPASDDPDAVGRVYVFTRDVVTPPQAGTGEPPPPVEADDAAAAAEPTADCGDDASIASLECGLAALIARARDEDLSRLLERALIGVQRAADARGRRRAHALRRAVRAIGRFEGRLASTAVGSVDVRAQLEAATAIDWQLRALLRSSR